MNLIYFDLNFVLYPSKIDYYFIIFLGEEQFLFGSYKESVAFWKRELLEASLQGKL